MELKDDFKKTEAGVIPNDWDVHLIQNLIDEKAILDHIDGNHGELYPRSHEFKQYGIPYVAANTLVNGQVNFDACKFLSEERAAQFRKGIAKDGDVLFAHNATVGPVAVLRTKLNYVILSTTVTYFRCNPDEINNAFLFYNLQAPFFVKQYQAVMSQSTRNQVPITAQRKFSLALPPTKTEQTAIANVLSDADALIQSLTRLITKKRQIKQGAMQILLNPYENGRLKEGWVVKKLGDIADVIGGGTPSSFNSSYWNGDIDWYTPTEIGKNKYVYESRRKITKEGYSNSSANFLPIGAILLTSRAGIGDLGILMNVGCTNQGFQSLISKESTNNEFLYYLMGTLKNQLLQNASGSTFLEISPGKLKEIEVVVPQITEQAHIATILSDMDVEIAALETKLAKYQQIKSGMMQNLLMGCIRLVKPESKTGEAV